MLTFAGNFWALFWVVMGIGAVLSVLLPYAVAKNWPEQRKHDAMLIELAAAYREHADAA
jgi:preprotein translocase subunit Sec63